MNRQEAAVTDASERPAFEPGYYFRLSDRRWVLSNQVNFQLEEFYERLDQRVLVGFLNTLAYYAEHCGAKSAYDVRATFLRFLRETGASEITIEALLNFRSQFDRPRLKRRLAMLRAFLIRWYELDYYGITEEVHSLLSSWKISADVKGDAVKRLDPHDGPFTEIELQAINEGVIQAFEKEEISLMMLVLVLLLSSTGRRPAQISQLKVVDLSTAQNNRGDPLYLANIPRVKQGGRFRSDFRQCALGPEMYALIRFQIERVVEEFELQLGCDLPKDVVAQLPIFPSGVKMVHSLGEVRDSLLNDQLHLSPKRISRIITNIGNKVFILSERTGARLKIVARRFRYTIGTRAAMEGFGQNLIARLLDHSTTESAHVYVQNIPEFAVNIDKAVGEPMARLAKAFAGQIIDCECDATRGGDLSSRIRCGEGSIVGNCGESGSCSANVPIPCYTCRYFEAWRDGPHEEVYRELIVERKHLAECTGDIAVASILDRTILAVLNVVESCRSKDSVQKLKRLS